MPSRFVNRLSTFLITATLLISILGLPAQGQEKITLEVGYIPIMPMAQLFVMEGEGWTEEAGLELKLTRFSSGPAMIQALASGTLEVMYFGIGPAMVARSRGIDIQVVAANVVEQVALIAQGEFAGQMKGASGAEGIRTFNEQAGRKVKIATLPKGSVPDTVLRYWLVKVLGVDLDEVEIAGMGASAVQQALLSGSVDAASILEPILTIVEKRLPSAIVIARGSDMLPNQPGAVVAVRGDVLDRHPQAIARLVDLHVHATELLKTDPRRAARHVHAFIGKGLLPLPLLEQAIVSPSSNFVADPHVIIEATRTMLDFQREMGLLKEEVDLDTLFNTRFYDALKR